MLRRKFILTLASMVALLLITPIGAIWRLERVIVDLRHVSEESMRGADPAHLEAEHLALIARFRWLVLGITLLFILVINLSVIGLFRMTSLVLRPMEQLTEATRQLAQEHFDYRVDLHQHDEFDDLATAYNSMAARLQDNECRKLEMLGQVALALNHELNNAAGIISLQLELLRRQTQGNPAAEGCARQIHESLSRMTRSVQALKHVRRIVLTDYVEGVKMLDLEKSANETGEADAPVGVHA